MGAWHKISNTCPKNNMQKPLSIKKLLRFSFFDPLTYIVLSVFRDGNMGHRLDENTTLKNLIFIGVYCDTIKHQLWLPSGSYMALGMGTGRETFRKKEAQIGTNFLFTKLRLS
jgi:hypothetical protein